MQIGTRTASSYSSYSILFSAHYFLELELILIIKILHKKDNDNIKDNNIKDNIMLRVM